MLLYELHEGAEVFTFFCFGERNHFFPICETKKFRGCAWVAGLQLEDIFQ